MSHWGNNVQGGVEFMEIIAKLRESFSLTPDWLERSLAAVKLPEVSLGFLGRMPALADARLLPILAAVILSISGLPQKCFAASSFGSTTKVEHRPTYDIRVHYPIVRDLPNSARINHLIRQFIQRQITEYRRSLGDSVKEPTRGFLHVDYKVSLKTTDLLSLRFDISAYSPGAAHPSHTSTGINVSPVSGNEIQLDEIFCSGVDCSELLSVLSVSSLLQQNPDLDLNALLSGGAGPDTKNFQNFTLSDKAVSVYFNEYQLDAYAAGMQTVTLPYSEMYGLLAPGSAIYDLSTKTGTEQNIEYGKSEMTPQDRLATAAIRVFSTLIYKHPNDPAAYYQRSAWYEKLKRSIAAQNDIQHARSLEGSLSSSAESTSTPSQTTDKSPTAGSLGSSPKSTPTPDQTSEKSPTAGSLDSSPKSTPPPDQISNKSPVERSNKIDIGILGLKFVISAQHVPEISVVFPDTPASKGALRKGDAIIEVNGVQTKDLDKEKLFHMLTGEPKTKVILKIRRLGKTFTKRLTRMDSIDFAKIHPDIWKDYLLNM